jgi:hypothetical protein
MANGALLGGLAQGIMGGYQFADQAMADRQARERQQMLDERALKQQDTENQLRKQQLDIQQQHYQNQNRVWDAEAKAKELTNQTVEREQKKRDAAEILQRIWSFGANPKTAAQDADTLQKGFGVPIDSFFDGRITNSLRTMQGVLSGQIDVNSPDALKATNDVFGFRVQRGIGSQVDLPDQNIKGTVEKKEISQVLPMDNGFVGFKVRSYVKGKDGKTYTYDAPLTVHGSHDSNDQALLINQDAIEQHMVGLLQIQDMLDSDPDRASAMLSLLQVTKDRKAQLEERKIESEIGRNNAQGLKYTAQAGKAAGLYGEGKGKAAEFNFDPGRFEKAYELSNEPPEKPPEEPAFTGDKKTDEAIFKQHQKALQDYPKRVEAWKKERAKASEETQNLMRLNRLTMDEAISLRKPQNFFHGVDDEGKTRFPGQYVEGFLAQDENGQTRLYYSSVLDPKTGREMTPKEAKAAPKTGLVGGALEKDTPKTASKPAPKKSDKAPAKATSLSGNAKADRFLSGLSGNRSPGLSSTADRTKQVLDEYQRQQLLEKVKKVGVGSFMNR